MQKSPQRNESPVAKVSVAHSSHLEEALEKSQEQCKQLEAQVRKCMLESKIERYKVS